MSNGRKRKLSSSNHDHATQKVIKRRKINPKTKLQCNGKTKRDIRCQRSCTSPSMYCYLHQSQDPKKIPEWIDLDPDNYHLTQEQLHQLCQMVQLFTVHHDIYAHDIGWHRKLYLLNRPRPTNEFRESMERGDWLGNYLLGPPKYPEFCEERHIYEFYCNLTNILRWYETDNCNYDTSFARRNWHFDLHRCRRSREHGIIFKFNPTEGSEFWINEIKAKYGKWKPYPFIKLSLRVKAENNHRFIVPEIMEITSKREIKKIVGDKITTVWSSMIKLSNLLFDIIDEYDSIHHFEDNMSDIEDKFVEKLVARHWKYIGGHPINFDMSKYFKYIRKIQKEKDRIAREQESVFERCNEVYQSVAYEVRYALDTFCNIM